MSDFVEITPEGLFAHKWNGKKRKVVRKRVKKLTVVTHLRSRCEIAEGTTLKQIFDVVDKYKFLKLVISQYSWCRQLDEFHAQAAEPHQDESETKLDYLEIYHHPEVNQFTEKKKHPGGMRERTVTVDFDTSVGFHGIGPPPVGKEEDPQYKTDDGKIPYSVSYSPMWELADVPVKLNKQFDVYEPFDVNKHNRNNRQQKLLTATREYTLLEVLDAIYWDISFVGGPAENADFIDGMKETMDQIKNGEIAMIPMDQVFKDLSLVEVKEGDEPPMKILMHPDVARVFGIDPDSIPLDDKEIIRPDES